MLETLLGLVAFIFVLGVIILVHEGGHFLFARKANVLCREYAFGMGPLLFSKKKGETLYSIRAFPIGGFCAIAGEELEEDPLKDLTSVKLEIVDDVVVGIYLDTPKITFDKPVYNFQDHDIFDANDTGELFIDIIDDEGVVKRYSVDPKAILYQGKLEMQIAPHNRTMGAKSKTARALVVAGGPFFNFILALLVFFIAGLLQGSPNLASNVIDKDRSTSDADRAPIYLAGLQGGDQITYLISAENGSMPIESFEQLQEYFASYRDKKLTTPITVKYLSKGEEKEAYVSPKIAINNCGFASDDEYNVTKEVKVGMIITADDNLMSNVELKKDDIIKEISWYESDVLKTKNVASWSDVYPVFQEFTGGMKNDEQNYIYMKVMRLDTEGLVDVKVRPYSADVMDSQASLYGQEISNVDVYFGFSAARKFDLGHAFVTAGTGTASSFTAVFKTLRMLFNGSASITNLSGPVGIFDITKQVATTGLANIFALIGLLSVNVGLLNLLPIPALDGGRLVFIAYEAITKKKPNPKVETILITITMVLLLGLIIFVTFGDVMRLIGLK